MSLNWSKRRPVYEPWYARLDRDPFAREATNTIRHGVRPPPAKPAKPELVTRPAVKTAPKPHTVAPGALCRKYALRTSDVEKARAALTGVTKAMIWCDGGCAPKNPGTMGMGVVILSDEVRVEFFGGGGRGTNNAAELAAAIMALEAIPDGCRTTVIAESTYLVDGMTKWRHGWRQCDFKRSGVDIPNADRWRKLDALAAGRSIAWKWVRGHNGDPMNGLADKLAVLGRTGGRHE
ncbi:ribonuclease H family protein [Bradyrhizobium arachidis]|uniref:ribonuclease H n=1 Tax=Bradyrhizobium arachidis TaxID=858423 RepID=A0AAE7NJH1_9BRAD|nr:ribonuclease H [Bradyrhizobium arachidis]QOZ67153.1 ribonuclease HI [Bradyrhizobium arachidis]SFV16004.1 Ribonuclease HI [Bradyrhizobium arachidis]